jgi:sugar phosphate isomerase/epimerase
MMDRRSFLGTVAGAAATQGLLGSASAAPDSQIRYGISGQMWLGAHGYSNIEEGVLETARMGLDGIEPFRNHIIKYLPDPLAFKRQLDAAGIAMVSCSDGGRDMSSNFIDEAETQKTIADHVSFARDFIRLFGCTAFKFNLGARPANGIVTDAQLRTMVKTLDEIGRQTIAFGVRAAPHPHLWGPMEREHEVRTVLDTTDPRYVWFTPDAGHLTLCGMDPLKIMTEYYSRIAEVHYKDCDPKYRGNSVSPTQDMHRQKSLYLNLGAGGVDFPSIQALLLERRYRGWISLDFDAPRPGDGTGTLEDNIMANRNYLINVLNVTTLQPAKQGQSACAYECAPAEAPK